MPKHCGVEALLSIAVRGPTSRVLHCMPRQTWLAGFACSLAKPLDPDDSPTRKDDSSRLRWMDELTHCGLPWLLQYVELTNVSIHPLIHPFSLSPFASCPTASIIKVVSHLRLIPVNVNDTNLDEIYPSRI
ncbi:hypothetical protein PHSY_005061 [Pseudozyma hubeiensis SY62]|uniref:Uncharacterized protein n=1 Tax=Pseudozyma hubeiensis (strain SY62) TaxID=1305764 RepID=R9PHA5_PSEHS|nr:hypothetical protein PHSY_005061 [Pseudozyma hubeiensis SY62]GAC97475.1 hypothetical protein PHSY_005061 [Pseudozyma hubeiensis SY62]